ncbi:MAG TPA: hypothetical protein VGG29_06695 [Caulobacteraceae bacterium]
MFWLIGIATLVGMGAVLWLALKRGRTDFWFFGFANTRDERPILYWFQIAGYAFAMALVAYVVGAFALAAISN